jgi:hypothetical protein
VPKADILTDDTPSSEEQEEEAADVTDTIGRFARGLVRVTLTLFSRHIFAPT